MLLAILDTNRKFQTTHIVIAFALPFGTTMEQPAQMQEEHMAELLVMVLMVDVKVLVFGN